MDESLIASAFEKMGKQPRPIQLDYAKAVSESLENPGVISLLHAETGVGKSLGYLIPATALLAQKPGSRLVIATQSHALLNQLSEKDVPDIRKVVQEMTGRTLSFSKLLGRSNYVDPHRVESAIFGRVINDAEQKLIDVLVGWSLTIPEFIEEYGELPLELTMGQICMLPTSKNADYDLRREGALNADIILTTHAMIAVDMVLAGAILHKEKPTYLIVDEADMLIALLKDMQVRRLNLQRVYNEISDAMTASQSKRLLGLMDAIRDETRQASVIWSEKADELAEEVLFFLGMVSSKLDEVPETLKMINHLRGEGELGLGVSTVREEPAVICVDTWASRRFAGYISGRSAGCILTSGTLSITQDPIKGMQWLRTELGIEYQGNLGIQAMFSPTDYGKLSLTLAGSEFPSVFISDEEEEVALNPKWVAAAAACIKDLKGKMVVLTNSHRESERIEKELIEIGESRQIHRHMQGNKLKVSLDSFKATGGILITPAGHIGLDIRNEKGELGFDELVITRVGFAPPKTESLRALAAFNQARNKDKRDILPFLIRQAYVNSLGEAIRKGRQSIGRGIRSEKDEINVTILDSRFPLFTDLSGKHTALRNIIPYRFQTSHRDAHVISPAANKTDVSEVIF